MEENKKEEAAKVLDEFKKFTEGKCPNCGYCPHCGRSNAAPMYPTYPINPWWNRPYPYWWGDVWCQTLTGNGLSLATQATFTTNATNS